MSGEVPPEPVTGVKEVAAVLFVSVFEATDWVAVTTSLTVSEKVLLAVELFASVTVTV